MTLVEAIRRAEQGVLLLGGWFAAQNGDQDAHDRIDRRMGELAQLMAVDDVTPGREATR